MIQGNRVASFAQGVHHDTFERYGGFRLDALSVAAGSPDARIASLQQKLRHTTKDELRGGRNLAIENRGHLRQQTAD